MHSLTEELFGDPLDSDLHFGYFQVIEGLIVASEGLPRVLGQHQDAFHAVGGHVEIDIPEGVALVFAEFSVPQYPVVQDREVAFVLVADHAGQLWQSDHVILETDVLNAVGGVVIAHGPHHVAVVLKGGSYSRRSPSALW